MNRKIAALLFFVFLFIVWEGLARAQIWSPMLLPAPSAVIVYLIESFGDGTLEDAIYVTLRRLFLGYGAGVVFGIPIGLLNARFQFLDDTLGVIAVGFQALPSICWTPLALLWFGQTETAMFFIVVMGSVWSIALATDAGARNVPSIYIRAAQTLGSKGLHTWLKVIFPASLPFVVSGMKLGWAFAWRSLMAAEIYITLLSGFGLGFLLHYNRELQVMAGVVGVMFVIIFLGLIVNMAVFAPLERFLLNRWGTMKNY